MRDSGLWIFIFCIILNGAATTTVFSSDLDFAVGVGYEFISQEFFLDSLIESGQDSLAATSALKTTYLDDIRGQLSLKYSPLKDRRLLLQTHYEQSSEFVRAKFVTDFHSITGRHRLDFSSEFDWRGRYAKTAEAGDDYLTGQVRGKLTLPLNGSMSARWQIQADFVNFDSTSTFIYNSYRIGIKAGLGKFFAGFSMLDLDLFVHTRQVPDSTQLNYLSFGAQGAYMGFYEKGDFDMFWWVERKDYRQPDDEGDYWRLELDCRNKTQLSDKYFCSQDVDFELNIFSSSDPITYDYTRLGLTILLGREKDGLELALGLDFEYQNELNNELGSTDTYFESGLAAEIGFIRFDQAFCSLESSLGCRTLKSESDLQTGFAFERFNLITDCKLLGSLNFNILLSAEWEWHSNSEENSQIFLLSSGLSYNL